METRGTPLSSTSSWLDSIRSLVGRSDFADETDAETVGEALNVRYHEKGNTSAFCEAILSSRVRDAKWGQRTQEGKD